MLLDVIRRSAVLVADIAQDELGVLVDREHAISCCVSAVVFLYAYIRDDIIPVALHNISTGYT